MTFDEWFSKNNFGFSFETKYLQPHMDKSAAFLSLTKEIRKYVSEMVQK